MANAVIATVLYEARSRCSVSDRACRFNRAVSHRLSSDAMIVIRGDPCSLTIIVVSSTAIRSSTIVPEVPAASDRSSATKQDVDGIPGDAHALIAAANSSNAANIAGLKDKYGDDTKASTSI